MLQRLQLLLLLALGMAAWCHLSICAAQPPQEIQGQQQLRGGGRRYVRRAQGQHGFPPNGNATNPNATSSSAGALD